MATGVATRVKPGHDTQLTTHPPTTTVRRTNTRTPMRKIIDLECDLPPDEHGNLRKNLAMNHPPGFGDP